MGITLKKEKRTYTTMLERSTGGASKSVRCVGEGAVQHQQRRRSRWAWRGRGAEIVAKRAWAGARRRADGKRREVHLQPLV
jgi:hypothetical protein